jgi:dTDP-glucose 4,6-dehydratase
MRVLITGGAGFIGSHLCERFLKDGHEVVCVDSLLTSNIANIDSFFGRDGFVFIKLDCTEYLHIPGHLDAILHFASPASPVDYLKFPIETLKVGSMGTHKMLGLAKEKGARFLLASTSEVYGDPLVHPQPESYWGNVSSIGPRSVYDESKRFAEAITMAYHRYHGLDTKIARIFNTYGPRMRMGDGRVVPAFLTQAIRGGALPVFGDGSQTRSFCYVSDLVEGIIRLLNSEEHLPVNIGNPNEFTVLELAHIVSKMFGVELEIRNMPLPVDDPKVRRPDITRAREILGWEPKIPLEEGLESTAAYFRKVMSAQGE